MKGFFLFVFVILPVFYLGRKSFQLFKAYLEERNLKKEILILTAENEAMRKRIEEYRKGKTMEAKARDDLGMIKKGERIYIIKK
ncbi:MAG: septum formation initiator family protein [candidate division WOR-3 bacterium]